jgi:transcriptional regulator with XRE-family HTH domain
MSKSSDITGRQIAAARILAGLGEKDLAGRANVSVATLGRIEAGDVAPPELMNAVLAVRRALEAAGVEFADGAEPGVRMKAATPSSPTTPAASDESALPEIPNEAEPYDGSPL